MPALVAGGGWDAPRWTHRGLKWPHAADAVICRSGMRPFLVSSTATSLSTGAFHAAMAARTWPRASAAAASITAPPAG